MVISNPPLRNNKNKTNRQWIIEWFGTGVFLLALFVCLFVAFHFLPNFIAFILLVILLLTAFITTFIFLARTIGVFMTLFFPNKEANSINIRKEHITISRKDGVTDTYEWNTIRRIILSEQLDGIYINSEVKKESYAAPVNYKTLESTIDAVLAENPGIALKKEVQWIDSNQQGLNPHKDPKGVDRTYQSGGFENVVSSKHGVETIYYSR